jgi:hypothetical protein
MKKEVKISDLKPGPIQHKGLPGGIVERIRAYKAVLADVETSSVEQTIEDFQRDLNPEKELRIWEQIASHYQWFVVGNPGLTQSEKKDVFSVLLGISMGAQDFSNIKNLPVEKVDKIVKHFS